ncbi:uncharacterized protein LOC119734793 [Patiria miniata]|uniref:SWIM-type domain-containing protein n=1 Tax=Patiria miniata TaxID=46514 RepID=A0A914AL29_PATMI|nr:uncharacterized protein LOC119734793 [Patiria miniata]
MKDMCAVSKFNYCFKKINKHYRYLILISDIYDFYINGPACDDHPNLNHRSISEGLNYLHSGWVGAIKHCYKTVNKDIITLAVQIRFSQRIINFHNVEVTVNKANRQIVTVKCNCTASEGKSCSHSAGLLFKIVEANKCGFTASSCTDKECIWNHSTQENVLPDSISNIRGKNESTVNTSLAFDTDEQLMDHLNSSTLKELSAIPGTILNHLKSAKPLSHPHNKRTLPDHELHNTNMECPACFMTYEKYVHLSTTDAVLLAQSTVNQKCALWTTQRKLRITSSTAASVPKKVGTDLPSGLQIICTQHS